MEKKPLISIIIFPGSNCDRDLIVAIKKTLNVETQIIWHNEKKIPKSDIIFIPGGFSFGDYLRAGVLATKSPAIKELIRWSKKGVKIIGICNGFQILTECKLLPGTLIKNINPSFLCKDIYLKPNKNNEMIKNISKETLKLPIAHSQGSFYCEKEQLKLLQDKNQIAFQYCDAEGNINKRNNPNGSMLNIAGVTNSKQNILGMMPHPERAIDLRGLNDGKFFFQGLKQL
tara:strand:+ start:64 stop:750 length:687 start_codon:yes stop_codon:yes gene_type:complete